MIDTESRLKLSEDIRKEFRVNPDGRCFSSIRGAARLLNVRYNSIWNHFKPGQEKPTRLTQMLIEKGFDVANWNQEGIPDTALAYIAKYYAEDARHNCTREAQQLYELFAAVGPRTLIQQSIGWTPDSPMTVKMHPQIATYRRLGRSEEWIEKRLIAMDRRKTYKEIHRYSGCNDFHIAHCTNEVYKAIVGGTAPQIRLQRGLPRADNLRNSLNEEDLTAVACAEQAAVIAITTNNLKGYRACKTVNIEYAQAIGDIFRNARTVRMLPDGNGNTVN